MRKIRTCYFLSFFLTRQREPRASRDEKLCAETAGFHQARNDGVTCLPLYDPGRPDMRAAVLVQDGTSEEDRHNRADRARLGQQASAVYHNSDR